MQLPLQKCDCEKIFEETAANQSNKEKQNTDTHVHSTIDIYFTYPEKFIYDIFLRLKTAILTPIAQNINSGFSLSPWKPPSLNQ